MGQKERDLTVTHELHVDAQADGGNEPRVRLVDQQREDDAKHEAAKTWTGGWVGGRVDGWMDG